MSIRRIGHRRKREKNGKPATLNLVSLMDIFTILVFFLMVNSSEVEVIELQANIKLPDSNAQHRPEERLLISVNADDLIVQGIKVASIEALMLQDEDTISELKMALAKHQNMKASGDIGAEIQDNAVTIMGDRELPYKLLKRIMLTCQRADYSRIALAVNRTTNDQAVVTQSTANKIVAEVKVNKGETNELLG